MKNLFTFLLVFICLTMLGTTAWGQLFEENFDYTSGTLLTNNGWTAHSGAGTVPQTVAYTGLTYTGYASSGIGMSDTIRTSGEDVNKTWATSPGGTTGTTIYWSALINLASVPTTGDYFMHLQKGLTTFNARLWTKRKPTDASLYSFGISKTSTAANVAYTDSIYSINTTYLVVVKYIYIAGITNDSVHIFINPVPGDPEPSPTLRNLISADVGGADLDTAYAIGIRQGSNTPQGRIDGIRVGTTWGSVTEAAATTTTTATQLTNGIASSPLVASTTDKAILGFDLTSTGTPNFTAINIQNTQTPTGRYTNPKIYVSTDNDYSSAGDNSFVANGSINGTQLQFTGFTEALSGSAKNYFIVVDVDGSVTGGTTSSQPSFTESDVTVSDGTVNTVTITGTDYSFLAAGTPTITLTGSLSYFGMFVVGSTSSEQTYTVKGDDLTNDITVTAPSHFEISKTTSSGFGSSLTFYQTGGVVAESTVYARFSPTTTGAKSGNITHTSLGATQQDQAVSGTSIAVEPTVQASAVGFGSITKYGMTVSWTNGDGTDRIVLAKAGSAVNDAPYDGTTYTDNAAFGSGMQIGTGNYVVYKGTGTSVPVTNLTPGVTYHFAVFEFNGSLGGENYLTPGATGSKATNTYTLTWQSTSSTAWETASNWYDEEISATSLVTPTSSYRVVIDGSRSATVNPSVTTAAQAAQSVVVGNGFILTISGASGVLVIGDGYAGNNDITIQNGGEIQNLSTAGSGNPLALASTSNDKFRIDNGGKYLHNTARSFATPYPVGACDFDVTSTVELGQAAGGSASFSGRTYGNFILSATAPKSYTASGGTNSFVNGTLTLSSSNVTFSPNMSAGQVTTINNINVIGGTFSPGSTNAWTLKITGDIDINSTVTLPATNVSVVFDGTTSIDGSGTATFGNGFTVNSLKSVSLGMDLAIGSGTITVDGTLDCGAGAISGTGGSVSVSNGATLKVGSTSGSGAINGNITATGGLTLVGATTVECNGLGAQYLAARTFNDLTINNSNGVSLVGNVNIDGTLLLSDGDLTTSGYTVNLGSTGTLSETAGNTVIGNVTVTRTVASPQDFGGIGFEMNSNGTSPGATTVTRVTGQGQGPAAQSIKRYFNITPTNNSGLDVDATFHYDESELNGHNESTLEMWKSIDGGANWTQEGGTPNAGANTVSMSNVSSFSRWTMTDDANPLVISGSQNSDIVAGVLSIPATISSLIDTAPEQIAVFDFEVRDGGGSADADLTGTLLNSIRVVKGASNTVADWSATIQGAELFDGVNSLGIATLHADSLSWSGSPIVTVPDDNNLTLTVKIYLKTSMPAGSDGKVFEFQINQSANVTVDASGSYMAPGGSDVVGSPGTTIDVQATKLAFTTQPQSGLLAGSNIAPVAVTAQDANSNTDGDYSGNVTLSSGTFTLASTDGGGLTQTASTGVASWTNLTSSTSGTGTVLADASGFSQAASNSITVTGNVVTSVKSGNWSANDTWDQNAKPSPTQTAVIAAGHTVTLTGADTCEALTVQNGGVFDYAFKLALRGTFTLEAGATAKVSAYQVIPGGGLTPYAFDIASTYEFYGSVTGFTYSLTQTSITFGNVNWNSTGNATPAVGMIIAGNLVKTNIGQLRGGSSTTSREIIVHGDVTVDGGYIVCNNAASGVTGGFDIDGNLTINSGGTLRGVNYTGDGTVKIGGNLINNGGTIEVDDGSGSGNFIVYFKGTGNANLDPGATNAFRTVNIAPGRTVNLINNNMTINSTYTMTDTGTFYCGTNIVAGDGNFTLLAGATLGIGSPDGITTSGATGNIQVAGTRTFSSEANYVYNGSNAQATGIGLPSEVNNLTINNVAGVALTPDMPPPPPPLAKKMVTDATLTVNGTLTLANGNLYTGAYIVGVGLTGTVSRTSGHVVGNMLKYFATDVTSQIFEIGDSTYYTPVDVSFASVTGGGSMRASTVKEEHYQIATSGLDATKSINRYYILSNNDIAFTTYNAIFNFVTGDVDPGANPMNFVAKRYNGVNWNAMAMGTRTLTSTEVTGVTSFSDFAIGEAVISSYTITATAGSNGTIDPSGSVIVSAGGDQTFNFYPASCYEVDSVFVDDVYVPDSTTSYTFYNVTATHTIHVTFKIMQYTLTVNVEGSGTVQKTPDKLLYNCGESVTLEAIPDDISWIFTGWSVDLSGSTNPEVILMDGSKSVTATFEQDSGYLVSYRSFLPESIALDKDNKGKINKYVLRKPDKIQFEFFVVVDSSNVNDLHLEFSVAIDTSQFPFGTIPSAATMNNPDGKMKKWDLTFSPALNSGDTVWVNGYGNKKTLQKVSKYYWTRSGVLVGAKKKNPIFTMNLPRLPMPNRVNALYETMLNKGTAYGPNGFVIGVNRKLTVPDSNKYYGWLQTTKYGDLLKTLYYKRMNMLNTGTPRGFDHLIGKTKDLVKQQKSLAPNKFDNKLLAELVALRVNITASAMGITPNGFGELVYTPSQGVYPVDYDGASVREIAAAGDAMMMGQYDATAGMKLFASPEEFDSLYLVVRLINGAFEGALDTSEFGAALHFTGTKQLKDVPFLVPNPYAIPAVITPMASTESEEPLGYTLYQNYPNPFNPTTTISFDLPEDAFVTLKIYNMLGQEVATLLDREELYEGTEEIEFSAEGIASGVYFYRIVAEGLDEDGATTSTYQTVKKMMLLK